jgi:hypothetical protein
MKNESEKCGRGGNERGRGEGGRKRRERVSIWNREREGGGKDTGKGGTDKEREGRR